MEDHSIIDFKSDIMKRKKIINYTFLSLLVIIAAAFYIYKEYNRTHKDTAMAKADFTIPAPALVQEFEKNEGPSNAKYLDKVIKVEGMVKEMLRDDKGYLSIVLGDTVSMSSVRCSIDSLHTDETAIVKEGDIIAVKGVCTGFNTDEMLGSDVILVRSVVDNKK
jgi:hypothetical protein